MTIKVVGMCTYLTNVDVDWRPADFAASNFVKAIKGKPLIGTSSDIRVGGVNVRLTEANRDEAVGWFGRWAVTRLSEEQPSGRLVLVPVPSSTAVVGFDGSYTALRLANEVASRAGGRAAVADVLRWTRAMHPAHQGGLREPDALLQNLVATGSPPPGNLVLVDDVLTKGGHMLACAERLRVSGAGRPALGLVVGRTNHMEQPDDPFAVVTERLSEIEPDLPGYRSYRVITNGRGVGWPGHHGFCSLWMPDERRGDFTRMVRSCRERHTFEGDFRWRQVTPENAPFHADLIDSFFADNRFMAHMIVTAASTADPAERQADPHVRRCLYMLNRMKMRFFASGAEPKAFHLRLAFPDQEPGMGDRLVEFERAVGGQGSVTILDQPWSENAAVQLADLLLTAVTADWEGAALNEGQLLVRDAIVRGLGWEEWGDLKGDTFMNSWKFNIWTYLNPKVAGRRMTSRPVKEYTPYRAEWQKKRG